MPKPWKTTTTESSLPGSGTATFGWPFLFWRVRRTHDGGFALHPRRGISRQTNGADRRAQFCANPRFRPAPKRSDVKTFRPRCGPVVLALATVPVTIGDARALLSRTCAYLRRVLISSVFVQRAHRRRRIRRACAPLQWSLQGAHGGGAGGVRAGADVKIFRGVVDSKKTVIRFRLSRPCLPNRVRRINRPMRSSPFKTTATLMTVDMAPLPRRNARQLPFRCPLRRSRRALPHP